MNKRYVAFDVETPNWANSRMSAIGITVVEGGRIVDEFYSLVNPEQDFHRFNIELTGITPEAVADKPTFAELWQEIEPIMKSSVLVAHSATFDLGVLAKCLNHYEIDGFPYSYYACTCVMGRACYPMLANHKLNTLCAHLNIDLMHHNAGSDSRACAKLLIDYMENGVDVEGFTRGYDFYHMCTSKVF